MTSLGLSQGSDFFIHLIYDLFGLSRVTTQGQGCGYMAYLDNILIYSRREKGHLEMLDNAFKHLLKTRLKIKLSNCSFFKEQINYLDHLVSGMSTLPVTHSNEALMKIFSTPFEPLPLIEPVTNTPLEVKKVVITPNTERLVQAYDILHDPPTAQTGDDIKLALENASPTDIPQLEENLISQPELTPDKVIKVKTKLNVLQKYTVAHRLPQV